MNVKFLFNLILVLTTFEFFTRAAKVKECKPKIRNKLKDKIPVLESLADELGKVSNTITYYFYTIVIKFAF